MGAIDVFVNSELEKTVASVAHYNERLMVNNVVNYLESRERRVLGLYGLRRTGKSIVMLHAIRDVGVSKCAYIVCDKGADFNDLIDLMGTLKKPYIFVDEITYCEDFIDHAARLSTIFTERGTKVVIAGTYSFALTAAQQHSLLGRIIMFNTSPCSYSEYKHLHTSATVYDYLRSGTVLLPDTFLTVESCNNYINDAIIANLVHTMENTDDPLYSSLLCTAGKELMPEIIYKCINKVSATCTERVLRRAFKESSLTAASERLGVKLSSSYVNNIGFVHDLTNVASRIAPAISNILRHMRVIGDLKEYNLVSNDYTPRGYLKFPGMQYRLAEGCISEIDDVNLGDKAREVLLGFLLEDCIVSNTPTSVKVKDTLGEYDMLTYSSKLKVCNAYEIKHSSKIVENQYKYLTNPELAEKVENKFGRIISRTVLYMGQSTVLPNGIVYKNIEEYLLGR